jgi:hypothetical protein
MAAAFLGLVALTLATLPIASAEPPPETTLQGLVLDASGVPEVGPVNMRVRIYEVLAPFGGETPLYEEEHLDVPLEQGVYDVVLGAGTSLSGTFDATLFADTNRFVEIEIDGEILAPRHPVSSVPYAFQASDSARLAGMTPAELAAGVLGGAYGTGGPVAIHLHRGSGGTQYIVPPGKMLVIEQILFNLTWENSGEPMELVIQHSTNPSGPVWHTRERYFTGLNTLANPLVLPEGKAALAPFASPSGQILHKVFLYGRLLDASNPPPVAIQLHRASGGTQYIVPPGKMLIIEHILFNETWENSGEPMELFIQHSTNPSGPVWSTGERYFTGLNTLANPLVLPEGKAALAPFASPSGQILHKVFLYGRLVDAGAYPLR